MFGKACISLPIKEEEWIILNFVSDFCNGLTCTHTRLFIIFLETVNLLAPYLCHSFLCFYFSSSGIVLLLCTFRETQQNAH